MLVATQSPRDAIQSPIAHTIIEQCPTQIFMPNPRGTREDYVDGFKLTEREFELIAADMTNESRRFLVKQGHDSVVAELNLSGFDDELAVLSGRTATVEVLDRVRAIVETIPTCGYPCCRRRDGYQDAQSFVVGSRHRWQRRGGTAQMVVIDPSAIGKQVDIAAHGAAAQSMKQQLDQAHAVLWR